MIVTISGSMRNFQQMLVVADEMTRCGDIVLMPYVRKGQSAASDEALDALHLRKIDMSEMVIVASCELGYFGESTRNEIDYALAEGKRVRYARVIRRDYTDSFTLTDEPEEKWCLTCSGKGTINGTLCTDCGECPGSGWRKGHKPNPAVIY